MSGSIENLAIYVADIKDHVLASSGSNLDGNKLWVWATTELAMDGAHAAFAVRCALSELASEGHIVFTLDDHIVHWNGANGWLRNLGFSTGLGGFAPTPKGLSQRRADTTPTDILWPEVALLLAESRLLLTQGHLLAAAAVARMTGEQGVARALDDLGIANDPDAGAAVKLRLLFDQLPSSAKRHRRPVDWSAASAALHHMRSIGNRVVHDGRVESESELHLALSGLRKSLEWLSAISALAGGDD